MTTGVAVDIKPLLGDDTPAERRRPQAISADYDTRLPPRLRSISTARYVKCKVSASTAELDAVQLMSACIRPRGSSLRRAIARTRGRGGAIHSGSPAAMVPSARRACCRRALGIQLAFAINPTRQGIGIVEFDDREIGRRRQIGVAIPRAEVMALPLALPCAGASSAESFGFGGRHRRPN